VAVDHGGRGLGGGDRRRRPAGASHHRTLGQGLTGTLRRASVLASLSLLLTSSHAPAAAQALGAPSELSPGAAPAEAPAAYALRQDLASVLARASADGGRRALLVVSLDRGDTLFSQRADEPLAPASNLKLYTTAAALSYLGPDFRWSTYLVAQGEVREGVLLGDLVLYGTGDPTLSRRMTEGAPRVLAALADSLRMLGVRRVQGDVVGDGSYFGGQGVGEGWNPDDLRAWYAAPTGALNADENVAGGRGRPFADPAAHAAALLREALGSRGISVGGRVRTRFDAAPSPGAEGRIVAVHLSPPLAQVAEVTNHVSHNLFADAMMRTVGRAAGGDGSFPAGAAAVRRLLAEAGADTSVVRMFDGSGLSRMDRVTARSTVNLLAWMARGPLADVYAASLPGAAEPGGLKRMYDSPAAGKLRAKTGTIHGVSSLSGYVTAAGGERLAFSIIANGVPDVHRAKRVEDEIGERLAAFRR
jgi:D-alanyl-D-alanine carboxypeptidase/D-alanyl-D-alanine-endopeptidase (penicillin-binding protein 4)